MSRRLIGLALTVGVLALVVAGCGSDNKKSSSGGSSGKLQVGVLLPDSQSSVRWETQDRPDLQQAFDAAGVKATIVNAQGDKNKQTTQAEQAITNGAKVLLLVDLDAGSGSAIIAKARAKGVKVIDYDRLTNGGGADFYVSFDNVQVGKLQGQGLVDCLKAKNVSKPRIATLNGSPTDNNATLFAEGYNSVLDPLYKSGDLVKGPDKSVPDWDNQKALTIFEGFLQQGKQIDGVLAANDGLGNAAIQALKKRNKSQIPVTGQDATAEGVQNILTGDQCMTVYKAIKKEADAASKLAIALVKGEDTSSLATATVKDPNTKKDVPSVLETPQTITKDNIKVLFDDGFLKRTDVCIGKVDALCTKAGL